MQLKVVTEPLGRSVFPLCGRVDHKYTPAACVQSEFNTSVTYTADRIWERRMELPFYEFQRV
jgi:hypothetical protein